ncbi:MAG: LysM peptidoglycan-binding domain-containing protein [Candidatus Levybacteria bacterium]|nr:LysM peptidoglycan-binding domain-containing protein [Candidatus Levybacteria bacterium]
MARKRKNIQTKQLLQEAAFSQQEQKSKITQFIERSHLRQSYTSLLLGIVVVIVVIIVGVSVVKGINGFAKKPTTEVSSDSTEKTKEAGTVYTVIEGDSLTSIADKFYGTPEKWVDIAKANNIEDETVAPGMKLTIPKATKPPEPTQTKEANGKISGETYTVGEGESLWDIAVRAYGDGYQWPRIVEANKLENPDYVPPGTVLKIPR